jgi:hypothetical protein
MLGEFVLGRKTPRRADVGGFWQFIGLWANEQVSRAAPSAITPTPLTPTLGGLYILKVIQIRSTKFSKIFVRIR